MGAAATGTPSAFWATKWTPATACTSQAASQAPNPPLRLPPLPPECEQYYRRVDACFARQGEDAEQLRQQNQDARLEALRQQPDQAACMALNQSFDQLAPHLSCQ